mgnify:CR=1 FL=1
MSVDLSKYLSLYVAEAGEHLAGFARDWLGARGQSREGWVGCREAFERARRARFGAARQTPR